MSVQRSAIEEEDDRILVEEARANFAHLQREPAGFRDGVRVYVMEDVRGYVKVGISNNPAVRVHSLSAGNPTRLRVVYASEVYSRGYAMAVEAAVHDFLAGANLGREWFHCGFETAIGAIRLMVASA